MIPADPDLGIIEGEASDNDPDVIAGMKRLAELREHQDEVPEVRP